MKRKLVSLYLTLILDHRYIGMRRRLGELRRLLTMKKRVVTVFLQLDDPYSYLLSYYLAFAIKRYKKVEFRFIICQALRGEYMPEPALLSEYARADCALLANEFGVPFLDIGTTPAVEYRRALLDFLAEEQDEEGFDETIIKALSVYWRGDSEGVARVIGRSKAENPETSVQIGKNQLLLRKMGHYNCATMYYAGEWYWGVDRLHYLLDLFESQKLNRYKEATPELASLQQARRLKLPATAPAAAASLPPLEMFHSFRSPYSYLALARIYRIADAFGLKLNIRPLLPLVMRGVAVPRPKLMYIVKDANREAKRLKVPFGRFSDPVGAGIERCIAAYYYAVSQKRERDFLWAVGQAIFAKGIDVNTDEGLEAVAERSGLFWPDLKEALKDESWRAKVKQNREDLSAAGLWGVPSFCIGNLTMWGQDRDWLLARKIEDMCAGGAGIME
jgi:2-hydroxychromene-2-carboxylate isomerase